MAPLIPKFIERLTRGQPVTIYGDGEQTRDFVYVKDIITANILAAESRAEGIFNIGSGKSVTLNQLVSLLIKLLGITGVAPVYEKSRPGDIRHSLADISQAKSFGYTPQFSLEDGLRAMLTL